MVNIEAVKESIAQMSQIFHQKLAEFEEKQQKISSSPSTSSASNLGSEFATFKAFTLHSLRTLQIQVELLARENDNLAMHARRKILLLHGIPEDKNEDILSVTSKVIVQNLKLSHFNVEDVSRCHRMGSLSSSGRPRPILFKVRDASVRSRIWATKTSLKGSGITLSEFLTKARHDAFMAARQQYGVTKCWTRDGFVYVIGIDNARHRICSVAELDRLPTQAAAVPRRAAAVGKEPTVVAAKTKRTATASKK